MTKPQRFGHLAKREKTVLNKIGAKLVTFRNHLLLSLFALIALLTWLNARMFSRGAHA